MEVRKKQGFVVIVLLVLVFMNKSWSFHLSKSNLYTPGKDPIAILNATNFKSTIHGQRNAWIVEFYNSWCGHCVRFAPEWIKLAQDVKGWKEVIGVAAIDCAVEENVQICQNYAAAFPTLKFFQANSLEGDLGKIFEGLKEIDAIRHSMIDFITTKESNPPSTWPDLHPINHLDMNSLWKDVPSNVSYVAILVEKLDSYLGREVILDTLSLAKHIRVVRAIKDRTPVIESFKETSNTFLILASRKGDLKTFVEPDDMRAGYVQFLEGFAKEKFNWKSPDLMDSNSETPSSASASAKKPVDDQRQAESNNFNDIDKVYLQDLENVLHYTFWQEVSLQQNITGSKLVALKSFMKLLAKYLPGREQVKSLLGQLHTWLEPKSEVTSDQLKHKLEEIQKSLSYELKMKEWVSCKGSFSYLRGYPCGLWVTFHTLTVSAYLENSKDLDYDPLEVLSGIRGYVMNFFSCRICVEHFTNMSSSLLEEVKTREDSVLWLWQAHNKVNLRLKGDETEDPSHPKQQFPTEVLCSNCRRDGDSQWDLDAVLDFLMSHYSPEETMATADVFKLGEEDGAGIIEPLPKQLHIPNERIDAKDTFDVSRDGIQKRDIKNSLGLGVEKVEVGASVFSKWGFGSADISLCILLYISSIVLLMICYFYILTRRRSFLSSLKRRTMNYFV